jgi:predicted alpha/beta-hydrolase family hydrolase
MFCGRSASRRLADVTVPFILFAHGAGVGSASAWMQAWKQRLAGVAEVETFDYPYMAAGRRRPDPLPVLIDAHRTALAAARREREGPLLLAGKSMGSRVGCHLALEERVSGLVCFGYPLRAAGSGKLRDAVLLELETPILFLSGSSDALCPLGELERVRERMRVESELVIVEGGDHSLLVKRTELERQGKTQEDVDSSLLQSIARFTRRVSG